MDQKNQKHPTRCSPEPLPAEAGSVLQDAAGPALQPRGATVRMRLLLAAAEVFARKGYSAASVNEIVEAAGVTKPVLYYYFQNKEGIFHAILQDASSDFMNLLETSRQNQGRVTTRISRLLEGLYTLCEENLQVVRLMYALHYGPPQGTPEHDIEIFHRKVEEIIMELAQEGIAAGELAGGDARDIVWAILGIFDAAMELTLCHPEVEFNREKLSRLLRILYLGIEPESQHSQGERQ